MSEPVVSRQMIARIADEAARVMVETGRRPVNPYPVGSDAAAAFRAALERYLLLHSAPEAQASA